MSRFFAGLFMFYDFLIYVFVIYAMLASNFFLFKKILTLWGENWIHAMNSVINEPETCCQVWITWSRGLFRFEFHVLFYLCDLSKGNYWSVNVWGFLWFLFLFYFFWKTNPSPQISSELWNFLVFEIWQHCWWHCSGEKRATFSVALICTQPVMFALFWCPQEDGGTHFLGMAVRQVIKRQQSITIHPRLNKRSCYGLCGKCKPCFLMRYCPPFGDATQRMCT